jgi:DNA repair exonuclease SbcCD ATPase subunit
MFNPRVAGGILSPMPRPLSERQSLEQELAGLPAQIAQYERDLEATPPENKSRRERFEWQIRRDRKRMAELEARLARLRG